MINNDLLISEISNFSFYILNSMFLIYSAKKKSLIALHISLIILFGGAGMGINEYIWIF